MEEKVTIWSYIGLAFMATAAAVMIGCVVYVFFI